MLVLVRQQKMLKSPVKAAIFQRGVALDVKPVSLLWRMVL
jgi:hypothetical protein